MGGDDHEEVLVIQDRQESRGKRFGKVAELDIPLQRQETSRRVTRMERSKRKRRESELDDHWIRGDVGKGERMGGEGSIDVAQ